MPNWLSKLFDSNEKELKRLKPLVDKINSLEPDFERLSDAELKAKTAEFKDRIARAVAEIKKQVTEANRELDEFRHRLDTTGDEFERSDESARIKRLEEKISQLKDEQRDTEGEILDDLLPEAFAAVREAAKRTLGQRHFDVQLIGGIVLHQGKIAEMKTGEGKTLVATLPLYLNSLTGEGVHLITVNDYLARRGPYWMGPVYHALGVSVSSIYPQQTPDENTPARLYDPKYDSGKENDPWRHFRPVTRYEAYRTDITYGTSSDFGFDYLRDNMVTDLSQCVQRHLNYAIVDEVDNLLIDEARTPLIISGPAEEAGQLYSAINNIVSKMKAKVLPHEPINFRDREEEDELEADYDYFAYEKNHTVRETPHGQEKLARAFKMRVEDIFGGWGGEEHANLSLEDTKLRNDIASIFRKSMMAHAWYQRDRNYVVRDGEVIIVDEFTGRLMYGRRYSEGLHQAIEAKERVKVKRESLTYASVTIQNYFRMYEKLAGMTGTAQTEAEEFYKIYKLEVVEIPTNKPMIREDYSDRIFKDEPSKFKAVVKEIEELHRKQQPVLIGTVSIDKSEIISDLLKRKGIKHQVLNANPTRTVEEAKIVEHAGELGAVTVATNMAGRGVDIVLGGIEPERPASDDKEALPEWEKAYSKWQNKHDKVIELGGLFVIGTERHEARRIDNQLRGRSGRQGDPGSSRFYVSLGDDIMKRFGGDRIKGVMEWAGMNEDTPIENRLLNRSIENAQIKVEGFHFDIRKNLVEYDDVVNQQRELFYGERKKILGGADLKANILSMIKEEIDEIINARIGDNRENGRDDRALLNDVLAIMPLPAGLNPDTAAPMSPEALEEKLLEQAEAVYSIREQEMGPEVMHELERRLLLRTLDILWIEHLTEMERQRLQAGWATLQQVKAVDAYKRLGGEQWDILDSNIRYTVARSIFRVSIVRKEVPRKLETPMVKAAAGMAQGGSKRPMQKITGKKIGRNDPCPCGSGKKYKNCHGR
jgi:preprotein translocase subunit SecA